MMRTGVKKKYRAWIAGCLLAVCACLPLLSYADTYEGPGWDTPEEAVMLYLEGMREQDVDKMVSACAVETHVDRFDMQAQLERVRAYTPAMIPRVPNSSDLLRTINIEIRRSSIMHAILWQVTAVCLDDKAYDFSQAIPFTGDNADEEIRAFVESFQKGFGEVDFSDLSVLGFLPPEQLSELYASERNQENIKAQIAPFGAEESRSVIAVFTVGDRLGALFCDAARYGDKWFIHNAHGNAAMLVGLPAASYGMFFGPAEALISALRGVGVDADTLLGNLVAP